MGSFFSKYCLKQSRSRPRLRPRSKQVNVQSFISEDGVNRLTIVEENTNHLMNGFLNIENSRKKSEKELKNIK